VTKVGRYTAALVATFIPLATAICVQMRRDAVFPRGVRETSGILYVPSGPAMRRLALEFDALAADVYWIRAIQYFGGERLATGRARNYDLLFPLLDITTSLDPYFTIAYRFGAIFLSEQYPGGAGRPDLAIALLQKGIAAQPTKWQYYHDVAFVHYWHLRDFKAAAEWFQKASEQPNAPNWLHPLVAAMLSAGGDRGSARVLFSQMLTADQEWLRRNAARRLRQLDALDVIDQLQRIVRQFPPPQGEPHSWQWLVRRRVLAGIPVDPTGVPYDLDPVSGQVRVSPSSELQPMPNEADPTLPR
jgi:tetratricopeptide (TPR) repeat protein